MSINKTLLNSKREILTFISQIYFGSLEIWFIDKRYFVSIPFLNKKNSITSIFLSHHLSILPSLKLGNTVCLNASWHVGRKDVHKYITCLMIFRAGARSPLLFKYMLNIWLEFNSIYHTLLNLTNHC